jgi:hypothetical protein
MYCQKLSSIKARGDRIWIWCFAPGCIHKKELNIDVLIQRFGTEFEFSHWNVVNKATFRCISCRRSDVRFTYIPGDVWRPRNRD